MYCIVEDKMFVVVTYLLIVILLFSETLSRLNLGCIVNFFRILLSVVCLHLQNFSVDHNNIYIHYYSYILTENINSLIF